MSSTQIKLESTSEVSLIDFMGGDDANAMSAWISFGADNEERLLDRKKVGGLINFLYSNRHATPFESTVFTFRIKTPVFVAREFFRHRSASYNEWSGRYSEMLPEFYLPALDRPLVQEGKPGDYYFVPGNPAQHNVVQEQTVKAYTQAWKSYQAMLNAGVAKEVARNVLPLGTYTYFYVTMNARNLMHFLSLRNDSHALAEIRDVAEQMEKILAEKMPLTYAAFVKDRDKQSKVAEILEVFGLDKLYEMAKNKKTYDTLYEKVKSIMNIEGEK